jgi:hypothetical protein
MSTVTMQELELETAELLPARETLGAVYCPHARSSSVSISQWNSSYNGNDNGNGNGGFFGGILNGNANGNLSGNNVAIVA